MTTGPLLFPKNYDIIVSLNTINTLKRKEYKMYTSKTKPTLTCYYFSSGDYIKRSLHFKYSLGEYPHLAPIGYKNVRDSANKPDIVIDTKEASIIMQLFRACALDEYSLDELTKFAQRRGLKNKNGKYVNSTNVLTILNNPFYYGEFYIHDKLYKHKYDTFIEKSLFDRVQEVLNSKMDNRLKH